MEALVAAVRTGDVASVCVAIQAAGNCVEGHDSTGETPIVAASAIGHEDVVRVLLDAGASASALNQAGFSAVGTAAYGGHAGIIELLLDANGPVDVRAGPNKYTPLESATWMGHIDAVEVLLARGAKIGLAPAGESALHWASLNHGHNNDEEKYARVVQALVASSADVDMRDTEGFTAVHLAAARGKTRIVDVLVAASANVNVAEPRFEHTPLKSAAYEGHLGCVRSLLEASADANASSKTGSTALLIACERGFPDVVAALIQCGADITQSMKRARSSAMDFALESRSRGTTDVVRFYSPHKADARNVLAEALAGPADALLSLLTRPETTHVLNESPLAPEATEELSLAKVRSKVTTHVLQLIASCQDPQSGGADSSSSCALSTVLEDLVPAKMLLESLCDNPLDSLKDHLPGRLQLWSPPDWFNQSVIGGIGDAISAHLASERAACAQDPETTARFHDRARSLLLDNLHIYVAALELAAKKHPDQAAQLYADVAAKAEQTMKRYPTRPCQPGLEAHHATVFDLKLQAARAYPAFAAFVHELAATTGATCTLATKLKKALRITEKQSLRGNVDTVVDVVRALVTAADFKEMLRVHTRLFEYHEAGRIEIVQFKDRLNRPTDAGWADLVYLIRVRPETTKVVSCEGHICEIQLVLHSLLTARRGMEGHEAYAEARHILEVLEAIQNPYIVDDVDRLSATEIRRELTALRDQVRILSDSAHSLTTANRSLTSEVERLAQENGHLRRELAERSK